MKRFSVGLLAGLLICFQTQAELSIATAPLSLSAGVTPNILLAVDDSGSMDSEILLPTNDGALWWNTTTQSFSGLNAEDEPAAGVLNVNKVGEANSTWKKYVYLFPNGHHSRSDPRGLRVYEDAEHDHFAVPPVPLFAFARSPDFNKAYFNPRDRYAPWPSVGDHTYHNINPTEAPSDPEKGSFTFDLTREIDLDGNNEKFKVFAGMPKPGMGSGTYRSAGRKDIAYFPATFYLAEALPASYGYTGSTMTGFAPDGVTSLLGYEIKPANFSTPEHYQAMIQNFANWFSYYRKRHLATRAGIAGSLFEVRKARVGYFTINSRNAVSMRSLEDVGERESFYGDIYGLGGNSGGTPNKQALKHAGNQFKRDDSNAPITASCQANAAILFTDGYSNTHNPDVGNADEHKGAPYADGVSNTMADIAMHFYDTHLRADLDSGKVPVDEACNRSDRLPSLDCKTDLHMLTYAVTLGARGTLYDPDNPLNPYSTPPSWPTEFPNRSPTAVDDLWHATINGRGAMLTADKPVEITDKLKSAITTILQSVGSASAVAANSTRLDANSRVFQARYDSRDWSGELLAYNVAGDGSLESRAWTTDTSTAIPAHDTRKIFTKNSSGGAEFLWDDLDDSQKIALTPDTSDTDRATVGPRVVNWLRGDQSREGTDTSLRIRTKRLGDIVNSTPFFHWKQNFGFSSLATEGASYASYVASKATEPAVIYVGANDGMLHAFKATTGEELFAYIPAGVYQNLYKLAQPDYEHRYFVDGPSQVHDAYLNSAWRSVLVGSTGAGGKSVFALDVSDPDGMTASDVLWEFHTSSSSSDKLGVALTNPVIARLASGDWVAIFGNGYNSGDSLKLFVLDLLTGDIIRVINTGVSGEDNGLGNIVPVDVDADRMTDHVYAGDLSGNVWKFDLTGSSSSDWAVAYEDSGNPAPLFIAKDADGVSQPITGRMAVGPGENGSVMVYFGTGKYFGASDGEVGTGPQTQSFYGIQDSGSQVSGRSDLVEQTIVSEGSTSLAGTGNSSESALRVVSNNTVDYTSHKGWYLDLKLVTATDGGGERVVEQPILRHGRVIFVTLQPSADSCDFGGTSHLMELDAKTGGRLAYAVFDANGDGIINSADLMTVDATSIPPSGKKFTEIISRPGIIDAGAKEYKYTSGSRGTLGVTTEKGGGYISGRQAWWQLR